MLLDYFCKRISIKLHCLVIVHLTGVQIVKKSGCDYRDFEQRMYTKLIQLIQFFFF